MKKNLFRTPVDAVITVVGSLLGLYFVYTVASFIFISGRWEIIRVNQSLMMTGGWPEENLTGLAIVIIILGFLGGVAAAISALTVEKPDDSIKQPSIAEKARELVTRLWPITAILLLMLALASTAGPWLLLAATVAAFVFGRLVGTFLPPRLKGVWVAGAVVLALLTLYGLNLYFEWDEWGGMWLNAFLAVISISLCLPFGVLLALGRRSTFPIVSGVCTSFIEFFRGVPLIALLLLANVALGFFLPANLDPGDVVKTIVVFVIFTSAYVAEIVRGGLQSVPRGQIEAARANGLTPIPTMMRIVLPQAIRNVIPALVGQSISLFKDTALAGIVMGFTDLLSAGELIPQQSAFAGQGLIVESLAVVLVVFWACTYTMSRESQRLETKLGVGSR